MATEGARFRFAGFVLDTDRLELRKGAERIEVQLKVLRLLRYLLESAERTGEQGGATRCPLARHHRQ